MLHLLAAWTDVELLAALPAGHQGTFAEIYQRYGPKLLEQGYRKAGARAAAEEMGTGYFYGPVAAARARGQHSEAARIPEHGRKIPRYQPDKKPAARTRTTRPTAAP